MQKPNKYVTKDFDGDNETKQRNILHKQFHSRFYVALGQETVIAKNSRIINLVVTFFGCQKNSLLRSKVRFDQFHEINTML